MSLSIPVISFLFLSSYSPFFFFVAFPLFQVKYRHRRENDEDENFIALAPAEDDNFNLETALNKDKDLPVVVRLVADDDSTNSDDDADKYNRYFDNGDINEENRMVMNESLAATETSYGVAHIMQWPNDDDTAVDTDEGDYLGKCRASEKNFSL